jgi:FAD/FMN-containing dehydrogenase
MNPELTYVNVGFWSTVPLPPGVDPAAGTVNRRIEEEIARLDGHKSLYSSAFYPADEFDQLYGGEEYRRIKREYDPENRLTALFAKVVQRR